MFHATGETTRPDCGDAFDVTLSDGEQKLKCALSLELNPYVYKGWLSGVGQLVRVEGWKYLLRDDAASLGEQFGIQSAGHASYAISAMGPGRCRRPCAARPRCRRLPPQPRRS